MKLYFFGDIVLEFLFDVVCYDIGKVTIPIVTLDRARSQGESEIVSFLWYGISRGSDGRFVFSPGLNRILWYGGTALAAIRIRGGILALIPSFNNHTRPRFCNSENMEQHGRLLLLSSGENFTHGGW